MKPNERKLLTVGTFFLLLTAMFAAYGVKAQKTRELTQDDDNKKASQKRVALVLGNGAYTKAKALPNPPNDAADMAQTLRDLGFEVISGVNQTKRQTETLIREFGTKLAASGGIGLFYYAGHGLQVNGENYLVPVDADIPEEDEVAYSAVPISLVLTKMMTAKNDLNIVILDACRNNPFARSWRSFRDNSNSDGLAKISPPTGTLVLYATEPGKIASDGAGRNGLFTEALLKQIKRPNLEYDQLVKALSSDVWERSNKQQLPWKEGNTLQDFYFVQTEQKPVVVVQTIDKSTKPEPTTENNQIRLNNYSETIKAGTVSKNSIGMELVWIPPGEFMMGSTEAEISEALYEAKNANKAVVREFFSIESPTHRVRITKGFWMGKFEVTQKQWEMIMGNNPSDYKDCGGTACPVEQVSWYDVQVYLKKLNANDSSFTYRLPTEAEWEYACRAGTTSAFAFGSTLSSKQARFDGRFPWSGTEKGEFVKKTAPVGSFQPNAWGLYDMHGNVWEWVNDWYGAYSSLDATDPVGPETGETKVIRGGSWVNFAALQRSAARTWSKPDFREANGFANPLKRVNIGFRVVASPK